MISNVEAALLAWTTSITGAVSPGGRHPAVFAWEGVKVSLHTNTGSDLLPESHPMIIFACPSDGRIVGNLYSPVIRACTSVPILNGSYGDKSALDVHRGLMALLRSWFLPANIAAISSALTTEGNISCTDLYVQAGHEAKVTTKSGHPAWQFEQPVKLCLFQN